MTDHMETPLALLERRLTDATALEEAARADWAASFVDAPNETANLYANLQWAQGYRAALRLAVDDVRELAAAPARCAVGDVLRYTGPVPDVDAPSWMRDLMTYRRALAGDEHEVFTTSGSQILRTGQFVIVHRVKA